MCFNSAHFLKTVVWTSSPKNPQSTASTFRTGEPARFPDDPQNIRRTYLVPSLPLLLRSLFLMVTYLTTSTPPCVEPSFFPKAVKIRELAKKTQVMLALSSFLVLKSYFFPNSILVKLRFSRVVAI